MIKKTFLSLKRRFWNLLLLSLLAMTLFTASCAVLAQVPTIPDEQIFKYCKPEEIYAHQNPLIPGYGKLMLSVYESLAYYDDLTVDSVGYKPLLAESWKWVNDTVFEIKIRKIAHFRDPWGPVTADDVVFSLQTELRTDIGGTISAISEYIDRVEKVDNYTVRVKYKENYANYKGTLAYILEAFIVSKNRWSKLLDEYGTNIVQYTNTEDPSEWDNSGPYTLLQYSREVILYKRVDNYWGEQLGWLFAPEYYGAYGDSSSDALYRLMDAHERDLNSQAPEITVEWKRARSNYLGTWNIEATDPFLIHGFEWVGHGFTLNYVRHPIFREKWFRMALAYATNYDKIVESGYYSQAIPGYWLPIHPNYLEDAKKFNYVLENNFPNVTYRNDGTARIPFDPNTAIAILQEHCDPGSSVENGWFYNGQKIGPFSLTVVAPWRATVVAGEVTAKEWSDIGIQTASNPVEIGAFFDARERKMDYDAIYNWYWVDTNPYGIHQAVFKWCAESQFWNPTLIPICWNGSYAPLPNIADTLRDLSGELMKYDRGTAGFDETLAQILEMLVPEVSFISIDLADAEHIWNNADRWTNYPTFDDPYEHRLSDSWDAVTMPIMKHVYPVKVDTIDFYLSADNTAPGEAVTAYVTLRNNGQYEQRYKVVINKGPAQSGWELWEKDILAWKIVKVPPGEETVELPITIEEAGTYTLVVDNWRIGKYDKGSPQTVALRVREPAPVTIEELADRVVSLEGELATLEGELATLEGELATLNEDLTTLNNQLGSVNNIVYASIGVAIISIIIAVVAIVYARTKGS